MQFRTVSIALPEHLLAAVEGRAHRDRTSMAQLVRDLLAREVGAERGLAAPMPRGREEDDDFEDFEVIDRTDHPAPPP